MIKVAAALNSFASSEATAPPSEEIFVLSASQLQDLVAQAIERATAPLAARIEVLEQKVRGRGNGPEIGWEQASQDATGSHTSSAQVVQNLREELGAFQEITARERAYDRQRIAALERRPAPTAPGTKTAARIEKISAVLKLRGGAASFKELQRELGLKPNQFSALVAKLDKRTFQVLINPRARDEKALRLRAFT